MHATNSDFTFVKTIFVTDEFVGYHQWWDAPSEVLYLRDKHRHLFKVRVEVGVEHADRQIEYHMLKRQLPSFLPRVDANANGERYFGGMSCEDIANSTLLNLIDVYPKQTYYAVEVSEDGENGSIVEARSFQP